MLSNDDCYHYLAVKSEELKWQPNGSMFALEIENKGSSSTTAPKTYTNFKSNQDMQPEFSENPIHSKYPDITIARLGPGQVYHVFAFLHICFMSIWPI